MRALVVAISATALLWGCTRTTELGAQEFPLVDAGADDPGPLDPPEDGGVDGPIIPILPTDAGCIFTGVEGIDGANVTSIASFEKVLVAGTPNGLFRSTDTGRTWTVSRPFANRMIAGVAGGLFGFVALTDDGMRSIAYASADGLVWSLATDGLPDELQAAALYPEGYEPMLITTAGQVFSFDSAERKWSAVSAPEGTISYASLGSTTVAVSQYGTEVSWREDDGAWARATLSPPSSAVQQVWATNEGFVLSTQNALYLALDGKAFTSIGLPPGEAFGPDAILRPAQDLVGAFAGGVWRTVTGASWERLGDANVREMGRGHAIAWDGTRLYVGTSEGVLRSEIGGSALAASNQGLTGATVRAVNRGGETVIAATGSDHLYRSTDAGKTFTQGPVLQPGAQFTALGRSGTTVFAGTDRFGIFRSLDDGETFAPVNDGFPTFIGEDGEQFREVRSIASSGETVLAGLSTGVARSGDGGQTWKTANVGLPIIGTDDFGGAVYPDIALLSAVNGTFFASTSSGLFRSTDDGSSWQDVSAGIPTGANGVAANLGAVVASGKSLFVAGYRWDLEALPVMLRSDDGGETWLNLSKSIPSGVVVTGLTNVGENLFAVFSHQPSSMEDSFQMAKDGTDWERVATAPRASWFGAIETTEDAVLVGTNGNGLTRLSLDACP